MIPGELTLVPWLFLQHRPSFSVKSLPEEESLCVCSACLAFLGLEDSLPTLSSGAPNCCTARVGGGEVPSSAQVPPTPTPGSLIVRPSPPVRAQEPSDSWPGLGSGGIAREVCGMSEPQAGQSGCRRSALAWQGSGDRCPWFAAGVTQPQSCRAVRR